MPYTNKFFHWHKDNFTPCSLYSETAWIQMARDNNHIWRITSKLVCSNNHHLISKSTYFWGWYKYCLSNAMVQDYFSSQWPSAFRVSFSLNDRVNMSSWCQIKVCSIQLLSGNKEKPKWMLTMNKSFKLSDYDCFLDIFNKSDRIFTFFYSEWKLLNS